MYYVTHFESRRVHNLEHCANNLSQDLMHRDKDFESSSAVFLSCETRLWVNTFRN